MKGREAQRKEFVSHQSHQRLPVWAFNDDFGAPSEDWQDSGSRLLGIGRVIVGFGFWLV